jgi:CRISPR type I-E-associated protein CasB/Cse2
MSANDFSTQAASWIARLSEQASHPGVRASLRSWFSDAARPRAFPALMSILGSLDDDNFNTVAALYAYHPEHRQDAGSLGALCRKLSGENSTFEGRFRRLLLCTGYELRKHLRGIILAARSKDHPVNYLQLYLDLHSWEHGYYGDRVRTQWASDYWTGSDIAVSQVSSV